MSTRTRHTGPAEGLLEGLLPASIVAVAAALAAVPAATQTQEQEIQDRVDLQQIETVPAGPSDVTSAPDAGKEAEAAGQTEAGAVVDENVAAAVRNGDTGQMQAADGGAEPTENWFGCKPTESGGMETCDESAQTSAGTGASQ